MLPLVRLNNVSVKGCRFHITKFFAEVDEALVSYKCDALARELPSGHARRSTLERAQIVKQREEDGPFESLWDFTERVDPAVANKRALESLVKCGAFDSTGASRKGMFAVLEQALGAGTAHHDALRFGQGSIFDLGDEPQRIHHPTIPAALNRPSRSSAALFSSPRDVANSSPVMLAVVVFVDIVGPHFIGQHYSKHVRRCAQDSSRCPRD